jgi:hypothetical protein
MDRTSGFRAVDITISHDLQLITRRQLVMDAPHSITDIVTRIERAMHRMTQVIHPLSPAQLQEPRLSDGRSVKDVLAHLTWWDQWLLITLPADQNTPIQPITLPLVDQIPPTEHWADEMNAKVRIHNQQRELSVIEAEFAAVRKQLLERVSQMSIDDLYDPNGIAAVIDQPVAPLILGIYEHYEEHAHELEQIRW